MADMKFMGLMILTFVIVVIGMSFLDITADEVAATGTLDRINESITIASNVGQTTRTDLRELVYFGNDTINSDDGGSVALDVGVNWTRAGVITVSNNFTDGASYNAVYQDGNDKYVANGTSRTLLNLVILFFALGVAFLALPFGIEKLKNMGGF